MNIKRSISSSGSSDSSNNTKTYPLINERYALWELKEKAKERITLWCSLCSTRMCVCLCLSECKCTICTFPIVKVIYCIVCKKKKYKKRIHFVYILIVLNSSFCFSTLLQYRYGCIIVIITGIKFTRQNPN